MKAIISYILAAGLFLAGLGLVGKSLYKVYFKEKAIQTNTSARADLEKVRASDLAALKSLDSSPEQISVSLGRYSSQNLPESEHLIQKYMASENVKIKAAALEASGAYPWASINDFKTALQSENPVLIMAAIHGLAKRSEEARINLILEYLTQSRLTDLYWLSAKITEHKLVSEQSKKDKILSEILERAAGVDLQLQDKIYTDLFILAPNQDKLKKLAIKILTSDSSDDLASSALQYEAGFDPEWVHAELEGLSIRNNYLYQIAVLDHLLATCPKYWESVVEKIRVQAASSIVTARIEDGSLLEKCGSKP